MQRECAGFFGLGEGETAARKQAKGRRAASPKHIAAVWPPDAALILTAMFIHQHFARPPVLRRICCAAVSFASLSVSCRTVKT